MSAAAGLAGLPRLLAGVSLDRPLDLDEHVERFGPLPWPNPGGGQELIETVERSGLRGRGGAGFSTGEKMRAVVAGSSRAIVVANATEGEPASQKDELLLAGSPHLVLDGVASAAAAVDASETVICVKQEASVALAAIHGALEERVGADADPVRPDIVEVPGGYVAGEESALVDYLNGGPGKPAFVPPRPFQRGVGGRPTLILNVETLANLALISRFGERWHRSLGTTEDPGSILITMSGAVASPGVYEVDCGTPLAEVLDAAGGPTGPLQAFLVGGYSGSWRRVDSALRLSLGHSTMRTAGANLGPGVVVALPTTTCGVVETARVACYLAEESAGQCGPCMYGLPAVADLLMKIAAGQADPGAHHQIERWGADITARGACKHPDGAIRFITSGLAIFADEIDLHERHHRCSAEAELEDVLPLPNRPEFKIEEA
jgi:NADH:ubiquinone oxidoreductase subunit F (NADH-binding)